MSDDGARRPTLHLRARVLIYFFSGWSPRDAMIHLYCQGVRMTRADYLSVIRAYCRLAGRDAGNGTLIFCA